LIRDKRNILIESGFPADAHNLFSELEKMSLTPKDIDFLALTHIHIDHAGGAGYLAKENPDLKIFVHEDGVKHLINPDKLVGIVKSVYGGKFFTIGQMLKIPEKEMIVSVSTGDKIDLGDTQLEVYYTPGHAKHHVIYFDRTSDSVFSGDALGSKYNTFPNFVLSPPSDYNKELAKQSIDLIKCLNPKRINFTHCGSYEIDAHDEFYENLKGKHDLWNKCVLEVVKENQNMSHEEIFEKFLERVPELRNFPTQFFSFKLSVKGILLYLKKSGNI